MTDTDEPVDQAAIDAAHPIEVDENGRLRYRLYSQDGTLLEMTCQDSSDMRRFVRWTRRFDRYGGRVMTDLEILEKARALIVDRKHWTQGSYARNDRGRAVFPDENGAVRFCAVGALLCIEPNPGWRETDPMSRLAVAAQTLHGGPALADINDGYTGLSPEKAHAAVLAIYDKAIELARAEG